MYLEKQSESNPLIVRNISTLVLLVNAVGPREAHLAVVDVALQIIRLLLAFPLLLVGGLFLLTRRNQGGGGSMPGGMGGPGGNNPMAFGKSKAKFQMEPNTGVTFDDVAGVDEAWGTEKAGQIAQMLQQQKDGQLVGSALCPALRTAHPHRPLWTI